MADYGISISLSAETARRLTDGGYSLFGFKAVETGAVDGQPTVWVKTERFGPTVTVDWFEEYEAYVSNSEIGDRVVVRAVGTTEIDVGQTWQVDDIGTGPVMNDGTPSAISIRNTSNLLWSASGISQKNESGMRTLCAFPLSGGNLNQMVPVEKVLLMFATDQVNTGTVIFKSFTPAILIDMTGVSERSVSYDVDEGWDWGNESWGTGYEAQSDLAPILITSGS